MATDALLRIVTAMVVLFIVVPRLARRRPADLDGMEWFWWCFAAGVTTLTLLGQIFTLAKIFSALTLLAALVSLILFSRARILGRPPLALVREQYRAVVVSSLNVLEGRVNLRRRTRRMLRSVGVGLRSSIVSQRWRILGWGSLVVVAASLRLIRPFSTANLGFSDTYAHLYLFRLLEQGIQVDPAWGPYPRGMHFLLMAIHELTNVDPILLLNIFGAIAGLLMTLAVADAARRLGASFRAGMIAGLLFATMVGGAAQYTLLGGSVATADAEEGRSFVELRHDQIPPTDGEYDVLQTVFQRQTATLPQELAVVLLFPASMFLLRFFQLQTAGADRRDARRWLLAGYFFCTSSIAAVHPGVAVPLVIMSAITVLATRPPVRAVIAAAASGAIGIALGSTWMVAFLRYRRVTRSAADVASGSDAGTTAMYYFPFLREGEAARIVTWVAITPVVMACATIAVALIVFALFRRERRAALLWTGGVTLAFLATHVASRAGWPEIVEVRRNSSWLAMSMATLAGVALAEAARTRIANVVVAALLVVWLARVPVATANDRLIHYSGYAATAFTVLEVERRFEPFTWTLVTYGQEFPMVLGKGFHLSAAEFLDKYDPHSNRLPIPTRYIFIVVEKTPHRFEINSWAARFSRADLQRRLQTWCFLYQREHGDIRVWHDDEQVRVYVIERSEEEIRRIVEGTS